MTSCKHSDSVDLTNLSRDKRLDLTVEKASSIELAFFVICFLLIVASLVWHVVSAFNRFA